MQISSHQLARLWSHKQQCKAGGTPLTLIVSLDLYQYKLDLKLAQSVLNLFWMGNTRSQMVSYCTQSLALLIRLSARVPLVMVVFEIRSPVYYELKNNHLLWWIILYAWCQKQPLALLCFGSLEMTNSRIGCFVLEECRIPVILNKEAIHRKVFFMYSCFSFRVNTKNPHQDHLACAAELPCDQMGMICGHLIMGLNVKRWSNLKGCMSFESSNLLFWFKKNKQKLHQIPR